MTVLMVLFLVCAVALSWLWHNKPAHPRVETDFPPPTPSPLDDTPRLDTLMERNTESTFLKLLIAQDAGQESRELQDGLSQAERHEKYLRRVLFLLWLLLMLSLIGLGYCAVLLPKVFHNPANLVMRSLCYLGVGSLVSWVAFLADFLRHRAVVGRLHRECRQQVLALAEFQSQELDAPGLAVHFRAQPPPQDDDGPSSIPGSAAISVT